jgi:uncharacterized membrane protein
VLHNFEQAFDIIVLVVVAIVASMLIEVDLVNYSFIAFIREAIMYKVMNHRTEKRCLIYSLFISFMFVILTPLGLNIALF